MAVSNNFSSSDLDLNGQVSFASPTALVWGPDGRLYITDVDGDVFVLTTAFGDHDSNGTNQFYVADATAVEVAPNVGAIKDIQNHNDNGTENGSTNRQITGIDVTKQFDADGNQQYIDSDGNLTTVAAGNTPAVTMYVTSSDSRIGAGGGGGDVNLDTNSGVITRLTQTGADDWDAVDIVRGLARSEENHATNGLEIQQVIDENGQLVSERMIVASGGNANTGAPSNNFAGQQETAYSAAILEVDLNMIKEMPVLTDNGRQYVYDIPTLDDPTRAGETDNNDPFGGNDGLNGGKLTADGPVTIYSPGYRNAYDVEITEDGRVWTYDNGANNSWGGRPIGEAGNSTESGLDPDYISTNLNNGDGNNSNDINLVDWNPSNLDNFHEITRSDDLGAGRQISNAENVATYTGDDGLTYFYGGHPNPARAEGSRAGLLFSPENGTENAFLLVSNQDSYGNDNGLSDYEEVIEWLQEVEANNADYPSNGIYGAGDGDLTKKVIAVTPGVAYDIYLQSDGSAEIVEQGGTSPGGEFIGTSGLPADIADIVGSPNRIEGDYLEAGQHDGALDTGFGSINGLAEYTSTLLDQGNVKMSGAIIATVFSGNLIIMGRNEDGTMSTSGGKATDRVEIERGGSGLGLATIGDDTAEMGLNQAYKGSIWLATYNQGQPKIEIFQPDNGTVPLAGSEITDPLDNDLDGVNEVADPFEYSAENGYALGAGETLTLDFDQLRNDFIGTYSNTGLLGAALDGETPNQDATSTEDGLYEADNQIPGANAPYLQIKNVVDGTVVGQENTARDVMQTGFRADPDVGRVVATMTVDNWVPALGHAVDEGQLSGMMFGDGTQSNFLRVVFGGTDGSGTPKLEVGYELGDAGYTVIGTANLSPLTVIGEDTITSIDLRLEIDIDDGYAVSVGYRLAGESEFTSVPLEGGAGFLLPSGVLQNVLNGTHTIGEGVDEQPSGAAIGFLTEDAGAGDLAAVNFQNLSIQAYGNEIDAETAGDVGAAGTQGDDTIVYTGSDTDLAPLAADVENFDGSGSAANYTVTANGNDNIIVVGSGANTIITGEGDDVVRGTLGTLAGDTLTDFDEDDTVVIADASTNDAISYTKGSARLTIGGSTITFDSPQFDEFDPADGQSTFRFTDGENGLEIRLVPNETLVTAVNAGSSSYTYYFDADGNVVDPSDPNSDTSITFNADVGGAGAQYLTDGSGDINGGSKIYSGTASTTQAQDYGPNALSELHWNERSSEQDYFGYEVDVDPGTYRVDIYTAEIYHGVNSTGAFANNQRVFDILVEGEVVEDNFDHYDFNTTPATEIKLSYTVEVTDGTFNLDIDGRASVGGVDQPKISGFALYELGGEPPADTTGPAIHSISVNNPQNVQDGVRIATVVLTDQVGFDADSFTDLDGGELDFTGIEPAGVSAPEVTLTNGGKTATLEYTLTAPEADNAWPTGEGQISVAAGAYSDAAGNTSAAADSAFILQPDLDGLAKGDLALAINVGPTTNGTADLEGDNDNTYGGAITGDTILDGIDLQADDPSYYSPSSKTGSNIDGLYPGSNPALDGSALHTYRDSANGSFTATYPIANGTYVVELHFAELYHTSGGNRQGDYTINGLPWEQNFDAFNAADALTPNVTGDGGDTPVTISKTVTVTDGQIVIDVNAETGEPGWNAITVYEAIDPNTPPTISVEGVTVIEGEDATVTFTRSGNAEEAVTIDFTVTEGSATEGADYTAPAASSVTIAAGERSATVTVSTIDDDVEEGAETLSVAIAAVSSASNDAEIADGTATVTIAASDSSLQIPAGGTLVNLDFETGTDPLGDGGFDGYLGGPTAADAAGNARFEGGELVLTTSNGDLSEGPTNASKNDFVKAVDMSDAALTEVYLTTRFDNPFASGQPNYVQQGIIVATGDPATQQNSLQFQKLIIGGNGGDVAQIWAQGNAATDATMTVAAMSAAAVANGGSSFTFDDVAEAELSMRFDKVADTTGVFVTFFDAEGNILGGVRPEATAGFLTQAPLSTPAAVVAAIDAGTSVVGVHSTDYNDPAAFEANWDFLTVTSPQFSDAPVEDTAGPTATVTLAAPEAADDPIVVTVVYEDASDIDPATIDAADVTLAGPTAPGMASAVFDADSNTATYTFAAPAGGWAEGGYTASVTDGEIADLAATPNVNAGGETASATLSFGDDAVEEFTPGDVLFAINAGGGEVDGADYGLGDANFQADAGGLWDLTQNTSSGANNNGTGLTYTGADLPDTIFTSERWGNEFSLNTELPNGTYFVELYFAETYQGVAGGAPDGGIGGRLFDTIIEGETVLDDYDLYDDGDGTLGDGEGQPLTKIVKTFQAEVTDGVLTVLFDAKGADSNDNAKISAVVVREAVPASTDILVSVEGPGEVVEDGDGADQTLTFTLTANDATFSGNVEMILSVDGTETTETLTFADGTASYEVAVPTDTTWNGAESVSLSLISVATEGVSPSSSATATATITEDDPADSHDLDGADPVVVGDFSDDRMAPSVIGAMQEGENILFASQQGDDAPGGRDRDYITFEVPEGMQLTELWLDGYETSEASPAQAFMGLQRGPALTVDPVDGTADAGSDGLIAGIVYGGNVGNDLLPILAAGEPGDAQGEDFPGFGGVLSAGTYTLWLNQGGPSTSVTLRAVVEAAPTEPGFAPTQDLDGDGIANAQDTDVDGDGVENGDETFSYDTTNAGTALAAGETVRLDFDTAGTPFQNGLTGALVSPNEAVQEVDLDNAEVSDGALNVTATDGDHYAGTNSQQNAFVSAYSAEEGLQVTTRFAVPDFNPANTEQSTSINYQAAGVVIGLDQDTMVKAVFGRSGPQFQLVQDNADGGSTSDVLTNVPTVDYATVSDIEIALEVSIDDSGDTPVAIATAVGTFFDADGDPIPAVTDFAFGQITLEGNLADAILNGIPVGAGVIQTSTQSDIDFNVSYDWLEVTALGTPVANEAPTTAPIDAGTAQENAAPVEIDLLEGATDSDSDTLSVANVSAQDADGNVVSVLQAESVLTIDPAQFAEALSAGESVTVTVSYDVTDGQGGATPNTATLVIEGLDGPATWYVDADGDGYGVDDPATNETAYTQPDGFADQAGDADDADGTVYPGAPEIEDGKDNDQDGEVDEGGTDPEPTIVRLEAETFTLTGDYRTESNSAASGNGMIGLQDYRGGPVETGTATVDLAGAGIAPGTYRVQIGYFDENDGEGSATLRINGEADRSWTFDDAGGSLVANAQSFRTIEFADVTVAAGDTLTLEGVSDALELTRIDYVEFIPQEGGGTPNTAPEATDDSVGTTVGVALTLDPSTLLVNDSDPDAGDTLTLTSVSGPADPAEGSVALVDGQVVFTPGAGFSGQTSFDYTVTDGTETDTATVTVSVTEAPNTAPVAVDDEGFSTGAGAALTITAAELLANDSDADGQTLSIESVSAVEGGEVSLADGVVTFTPTDGFSGAASFIYTVADGAGGTATATATIEVEAGETGAPGDGITFTSGAISGYDPDQDTGSGPFSISQDGAALTLSGNSWKKLALSDGFEVQQDTVLRFTFSSTEVSEISAIGLETNNSALQAGQPIFQIGGSQPLGAYFRQTDQYGTAEGEVTYEIDLSEWAGETFSHLVFVNDADAASASNSNGTFSNVTLGGRENAAPTAEPTSFEIDGGATLSLPVADLVALADDADGDTLTLTEVGAAQGGTVEILDGQVIFTPANGFIGQASFDYTVSDGLGGTATATIGIDVNTDPVANDDAGFEVAQDGMAFLVPGDLLGNDTDADGHAPTLVSVQDPVNGTVDYEDGQITFTPTPGFSGQAGFAYTISDGFGGTATAQATIEVGSPVDPDAGVTDIVFSAGALQSYSGQDLEPDAVTVSNGGDTVEISGNSWKKIALDGGYGVTDGTLLRVTVRSDQIGEIIGIGLEKDDAFNQGTNQPLFQLGGSQNIPTFFQQDYKTYTTPGETKTFEIDLSEWAGESFSHLVILNDADEPGAAGSNVVFSGVELVEQGAANADPTPQADSLSVEGGETAILTPGQLLANDTDPDGNTLTLTDVSNAVGGTVTYEDGLIYFTPAGGFAGEASFDYGVSDGFGGTATTTVTLVVNQAPETVADSFATDPGAALYLTPADLSDNDTDPDGDALTVTAVQSGAGGTVVLDDEGQIVFTPEDGFTGEARFTYTVTDPRGGTATGIATVAVGGEDTGGETGGPLDFSMLSSSSYATNQDAGTAVASVDGSTVTVNDNAWKKFALSQDVTIEADTVLRFELEIPSEGEIVAIGLDNDSSFEGGNQPIFQLAGSQNWPIANQTFLGEGMTSFEIPLGAFAGQSFSHLVLINDADAIQGTSAVFSNVSISTPPDDLAPEFTGSAAVEVAENETAVTTVTATDEDSTDLTFAIAGSGADSDLFVIDEGTGALSFASAPDFEAPGDADGDNVYELDVSVSDGSSTVTRSLEVTVTDVAEGSDDPVALLRINAFGPEVAATDGGPAWQADGSGSSNSPYLDVTQDRGDTFGYSGAAAAIPAGVPEAVLDTARSSDQPFGYDIPVSALQGNGNYTVNLYLAELYGPNQSAGNRVFDIAIEGQTLGVLDNYDPAADGGAGDVQVISYDVTVTDGELNLDFLQDAADGIDNPIVNAIEILSNPDATLDTTAPQAAITLTNPAEADAPLEVAVALSDAGGIDPTTLGAEDLQLSVGGFAVASEITLQGFEDGVARYSIAAPSGGWQDGIDIAVTLQSGAVSDLSSNANVAVTETTTLEIGGTTPPEDSVVYRLNAFGSEIAAGDGGPDWASDTGGANPYLVTSDSRGDTFGYTGDAAAIPEDVPEAVLDTARSSDAPFSYAIPTSVLGGGENFEVRLYVAELFSGGQDGGFRNFDATLEGFVPAAFNNIDPGTLSGADVSVLSARVNVDDGELNIGFLQDQLQNPIINAIEIVALGDDVENPGAPVEPTGALEAFAAQDDLDTGANYTGAIGSAVLEIMAGDNNIQSSNYGQNSFQVTNTGDKQISAIFLDVGSALYPDSVFDPDGLGGDNVAKPWEVNSDGGTGGYVTGTGYFLQGPDPIPNSNGSGGASNGGYKGAMVKFTDFDNGETVGFSGDMDPNSIAGMTKSAADSGSGWDVGGISGHELIGSLFTVLFDDGTTATGELASDGSLSGSHALATQEDGVIEASPGIAVNGIGADGTGTYGGARPTITVTGQPGDAVQITMSKGFNPVANTSNGIANLVEDRLDRYDFQANNTLDNETFTVEIGADGTYDASGLFDYGDDTTPIAFVATKVQSGGQELPISPTTAPIYLTNEGGPVTDGPTGGGGGTGAEGYFQLNGSGNAAYFKVQMEDPNANGGENPGGKWSFQDAPDGEGNQAGFQGDGYYLYGSETSTSINGVIESEILDYTIYVPEGETGTYNFRFRVARDGGEANDQQNDLLFNFFEDGTDGQLTDYAVLNGNSLHQGSGDFAKIFGGPNNGSWGFTSSVDGEPGDPGLAVQINDPGLYHVQIAGRSQGFHVDYWEAYKGGSPNLNAANSAFVEGEPGQDGGGTTDGEIRATIATGSDDTDQNANGSLNLAKADLELGDSGRDVGLRYTGLDLESLEGVEITDAYIEFTTRPGGGNSGTIDATISIQDSLSPATFSAGNGPTDRDTFDFITEWVDDDVPGAGATYRTADLSGMLEAFLSENAGDLSASDELAFVIEDQSGVRKAISFEGGDAPELVITWDDPFS